MQRLKGVLRWFFALFLVLGVLRPAFAEVAQEKPLGYTSLIQGVWDFPGLNFQAGVYWDALSSGDMALGASAAISTFANAADLRIGYVVHDPKVWGGVQKWDCQLLAISIAPEKLGLKPIKIFDGSAVSVWAGKNFFSTKDRPDLPGENPWRGGFNLTYGFK